MPTRMGVNESARPATGRSLEGQNRIEEEDPKPDSISPDHLKKNIHLPALLAHFQVPVEEGKARCLSPDHDDDHPSMAVFRVSASRRYGSPAHWRFKCHSCGVGGDAIQAVRLLLGVDWITALRTLAELAPTLAASSPPARVRDPDRVRRIYERSRAVDPVGMLGALLADKGLALDAAEVAEAWRVGVLDGPKPALVFPWLDEAGRAVAAKVRRPRYDRRLRRVGWSKPRAIQGSMLLDRLYGEHRDQRRPYVVLTEGESDTLAVSAWLDRADVLGIPGAAYRPGPRTLGRLSGRNVVLLFDGDPAGRSGAEAWRAEASTLPETRVAVARLPDGEDACSAGEAAVRRALREAVRDA